MTKSTICVAGYPREYLARDRTAPVALSGDHKPAGTPARVAALFRPDYLTEADAITVTDG